MENQRVYLSKKLLENALINLLKQKSLYKISIRELCDRVIWLEHGKIIKIGDTKEICKEYYDTQMKK